jgi:hypothetical protein
MTEQIDLDLKEIDRFYGTMQYYDVMGVNVTDGIRYVMDNGYSWLVTDAIAVFKACKEVMGEEFVSVELKVGREGAPAVVVYSDGNKRTLYEQAYRWTDARVGVKFWYDRLSNVICLPSEY